MKKFTTEEIRDLFNRVMIGEISFPEMVEVINERVREAEEPCVKDIPVRKFNVGDKVRIKEGISSKTHSHVSCSFVKDMDRYIGQGLVVAEVLDNAQYGIIYIMSHDLHTYAEDWLEPYVEELKEGDLAIFWDNHPKNAFIHVFDRHISPSDLMPCVDKAGLRWKNAIKFESKEQFERFIKGEIRQ